MKQFEKRYIIPASVKTVYSAWISPNTLVPPATRIEIDPIVGGNLVIHTKFCDVGSEMRGRFLAIEPYKRLVYNWEWNQDGQVSQVTVNFSGIGSDRTKIVLSHSGFRNSESATLHSDGWEHYFEGFIKLVADK